MKGFPSLLFLSNRGRFLAYRPTETGHLEVIDSFEPMEGNLKVSELVTDQAGAFPMGSPGTAGYESLPLLEELESRSIRQIAARIEEILEREKPPTWGLAAARDLNGRVLELLPAEHREALACNLKLDLTNSPPVTVRSRFELECRFPVPPH